MRERTDFYEELGSCRAYSQTRAYGRRQNTRWNETYVTQREVEGGRVKFLN